MTEDELRAIIIRDEEITVEFKLESERQPQLAEVLAAMANSQGGWLLVGVSDNGEIVGVGRPKTIIDRLNSAAGSVEPSLLGRVKVQSVRTANGKTVVIAHVPEELQAIHSVGGVYRIRIGSHNKILTFDQARALAYRRGILHYEQNGLRQVKLDDLDDTAIKNYLRKRLSNYTPELYQKLSRFEILQNLGCAIEEEGKQIPTITATLFFNSGPDLYVPGAQIIAARFAGTTTERVLDRVTIRGNTLKMIQGAADFIEKNIRHELKLPINFGQSMMSQEVPEYPVTAYREMIVNLVAHRDYHSVVPSHIMIFEDRIVAENPGGLLPGLSVETLENQHRPRNPRLIEMLHTMGFVERFGSGIGRIKSVMQKNHLPRPLFEADEHYFRVTLRNTNLPETAMRITHISQSIFIPGEESLTPDNTLHEKTILQKLPLVRLKPRQIEGLRYVIRNGKINNAIYRAVTGLAEDATLTDLKELMELRILQKIGTSGRSVYYVLHPSIDKNK